MTSPANCTVQLVALANHSMDANVTVGGGVSGTLTAPALLENGARINPFLLLPAQVAGVTTLTFSGNNTAAPIVGEAFAGVPFELTVSVLFTPDAPGVPMPIKLQEQHRTLFPLNQPITEESGRLIAEWGHAPHGCRLTLTEMST